MFPTILILCLQTSYNSFKWLSAGLQPIALCLILLFLLVCLLYIWILQRVLAFVLRGWNFTSFSTSIIFAKKLCRKIISQWKQHLLFYSKLCRAIKLIKSIVYKDSYLLHSNAFTVPTHLPGVSPLVPLLL